jgi:hypothetical protein
MKGFEVKFRNRIVKITVEEPIAMTIIAQKVRGKMDLQVGAWLSDIDKYVAWIEPNELIVGDEIIIERKEIEKSSAPLAPPPDFDPTYMSPDDISEMWKVRKQFFLRLERKLKEEGLI